MSSHDETRRAMTSKSFNEPTQASPAATVSSSGTTSPVSRQPSAEETIMARASWYYYIEGLTQNDIAARLGVHRTRVNRILAQARTRGIVQVRINLSLIHI